MTDVPDLPPEPGTVPDLEHGIPGDAEPAATGDGKWMAPEDYDVEHYSDDDDPDAYDGQDGLPDGYGVDDGLEDPVDDSPEEA